MEVRKIRRLCNVRGCRNVDSYAISRTREFGNSVIICKSCLVEALTAINEIEKPDAKEAKTEKVATDVKAEAKNEAETEKVEAEKSRSRYRRGDKEE